MKLYREFHLSIGALLAVQLLTSFGSIVLLTRTGPALEQILSENVASLTAAETMWHVLASEPGPGLPVGAQRELGQALARARQNITERGEQAEVEALERALPELAAGNPAARQTALTALRRLAEINRSSIQEADQRAQLLARGGAWAVIGLTALMLLLSIALIRRVNRQLLGPLLHMHGTVSAYHRGDTLRRCSPYDMPQELAAIGQTLNTLLDTHCVASSAGSDPPVDRDRSALLALLDAVEMPLAVLTREGEIVAASASALSVLSALQVPLDHALAAALDAASTGDSSELPPGALRIRSIREPYLVVEFPDLPEAEGEEENGPPPPQLHVGSPP